MLFISDSLVPEDSGGCARGPFVFVREKYKDDKGLIAHEYEHVHQWLVLSALGIPVAVLLYALGLLQYISYTPMFMLLHPLLYKFIPKYRLWAEVQCYKLQASYDKVDTLPFFAKVIATKYNLEISADKVLELLRK